MLDYLGKSKCLHRWFRSAYADDFDGTILDYNFYIEDK